MANPEAVERINTIIAQEQENIKSITVDKLIPLEYDLGNLLTEDKNVLDRKLLNDPKEVNDYLYSIARDGVQGLFTKIWELPSHHQNGMIYVTLPNCTTRLPREKPVPKEKQLTKWDKYRQEKGFNKRKKSKSVWDDTLKKWIPRYGYRKVAAEKEKNWVKEVPGNADPFEDQFEKASILKKEGIAKNEYKRLKNIARGKKINVPGVGITGGKFASTGDLGKAMHLAHHSTASLGKFQKRINKEKIPKIKSEGKKRTHDYVIGTSEENVRNLEIAKKMKKTELNLEEAVHKQIKFENYQLNNAKQEKPLRRSKAGIKKRGKSEQKAVVKGKGKMAKPGGFKIHNAGGKNKRSGGASSKKSGGGYKGKKGGGKSKR